MMIWLRVCASCVCVQLQSYPPTDVKQLLNTAKLLRRNEDERHGRASTRIQYRYPENTFASVNPPSLPNLFPPGAFQNIQESTRAFLDSAVTAAKDGSEVVIPTVTNAMSRFMIQTGGSVRRLWTQRVDNSAGDSNIEATAVPGSGSPLPLPSLLSRIQSRRAGRPVSQSFSSW